MISLNFWPILVSALVAFAMGAFWYSPILFGKEWMNLSNIPEDDATRESSGKMWKLYLGQFIITIVLFCILGFLITAIGPRTVENGMFLAFIIWIGFSLTTAIGKIFWHKTPLKLVLIEEFNNLITWVVGGAIIGAWK